MINKNIYLKLFIPILCLMTLFGCSQQPTNTNSSSQTASIQSNNLNATKSDSSENNTSNTAAKQTSPTLSLKDIPAFSNNAYIEINNNVPYFSDSDYSTSSFEKYSDLDKLGRCGVAYANVGLDIMPTTERGNIGSVKPSGWHSVKYENVDGKYLYNRCHLIGYQLTAENANNKNLITGTRYLNVQGMLPFENMVADYIKETGNHVLYRVTPIYDGDNLVASGVLMEAKSVEDKGAGICFNIYAYNSQPGITINYADGSSYLTATGESGSLSNSVGNKNSSNNNTSSSEKEQSNQNSNQSTSNATYVLNTNSHKFHKPSCASAKKTSSKNRKDFNGSRDEVISQGYTPCKNCNP